MVVVWKKPSDDFWKEPHYRHANEVKEEHRNQEGGSANQNAVHISLSIRQFVTIAIL